MRPSTMRLMKAVFVTAFSPIGKVPQHFQLGDVPAPPTELRDKDILMDIYASSLTRDDLHVAQGSHAGGIPYLQIKEPTEENPYILGSEFVGVARKVGAKVNTIQEGDVICGINDAPNQAQDGTWAEQAIAEEKTTVKVDKSNTQLSYIQVSALILPAFVGSSLMLEADIDGRAKEATSTMPLRCLVVGASGSIGSILIQLLLACSPNLHVTGVCSTPHVDRLGQLGAHHVYDYKKGSLRQQLQESGQPKFDVVFDLVGGKEIQDESIQHLLKPTKKSIFLTAVGPVRNIGQSILTKDEMNQYAVHLFLWMPFHALFKRDQATYKFVLPDRLTPQLWQPLMNAKIEPNVDRVVRFEETAMREGMEYVQTHKQASGKRVIIAIAPDAEKPISSSP